MTKFNRSIPKVDQRKIDDLCEVYIKHRGRDVRLIVTEMRKRGWRKFPETILYRSGNRDSPGWIQRLRLDELLSPQDREYLQIRRVRRGFEHWLRWVSPELVWTAKFQRHVYKKLKLLHTGEIKRLMIFMPPRHGKSEMVTVRYAAWRLLGQPDMNIVIGSYNQKLANRYSLKIKRVTESAGREIVYSLDNMRKIDEWETRSGGSVKAVGVGAGITGFGADLIIIDDPIKSRAEAESKTNREHIWDWFNDDIATRLEPNGAVILIQTRWHEDDLAGRLLKQMKDGKEQWEVIELPAIADENDALDRKIGTALWPERFDEKALEQARTRMGSYSFDALYQQRPSPKDGTHFKRKWFDGKVIHQAPNGLRWCRGYDLALSTKQTSDYTATFRCAMDRKGNLYIADGFRSRMEFPEQMRLIFKLIDTESRTEHGVEKAMHGLAVIQQLLRERRLARRAFRSVAVDKDKVTRALTWANRAEEGKVFLIDGPWIDEFITEICSFPQGKHDDQVDAVSIAVGMLDKSNKELHRF